MVDVPVANSNPVNLAAATQGKSVFVTEYAPFVMKHEVMLSVLHNSETVPSRESNPTVLSDELLGLFTPIIFVDHPVRIIPSWLRLAQNEYGSSTLDDEDFTLWTSLRWSRILFDHLRYNAHRKRRSSARVDSAHSAFSAGFDRGIVATSPFVIDAADVSNHPHATLATVCRLLGVELGEQSSWTTYFGKATEALKRAIPDSLLKAFHSNVLSAETEAFDIEQEMLGWKQEFGDNVAELLKRRVVEDMPHYDYLMNFKVRISPSRTMTAFMQNITGVPVRRQSAAPHMGTAPTAGVAPLKIIRSAVNGHPRERHFSYS